MPKLPCHCGFILDLTPLPLEGIKKFYFFDSEMDEELADRIVAASARLHQAPADEVIDTPADALVYGAMESGGTFLVCPNCGRLILSWRDEGLGDFYEPEPSRD